MRSKERLDFVWRTGLRLLGNKKTIELESDPAGGGAQGTCCRSHCSHDAFNQHLICLSLSVSLVYSSREANSKWNERHFQIPYCALQRAMIVVIIVAPVDAIENPRVDL